MQSTNPRNLREVLKAVKETLDKDGAPLVIINELTSTQGFLRQIRALGDAHNAQFENIIPHNFGKEDNDELIGVARMLKSTNLTDLIFYEASNSQDGRRLRIGETELYGIAHMGRWKLFF